MDIYEDRSEWQMSDHEDYDLYPLDWPDNAFHESIDDTDDDEAADDDVIDESGDAAEPAEDEAA